MLSEAVLVIESGGISITSTITSTTGTELHHRYPFHEISHSMSTKDCLAKDCLFRQLTLARKMTERLLADFHTPEQWTTQVQSQCNHALWFAGHMAHTDNFMITILDPSRGKKIPGFAERFGTGSVPTPNPADYPPSEEVVAAMRERREVLLSILNGLSEEDLAKPTPKGTPEFIPDYASIFETVVWHEGLHSGQLTVLRKILGFPPVMGNG